MSVKLGVWVLVLMAYLIAKQLEKIWEMLYEIQLSSESLEEAAGGRRNLQELGRNRQEAQMYCDMDNAATSKEQEVG